MNGVPNFIVTRMLHPMASQAKGGLPRITIPVSMQHRIKEARREQEKEMRQRHLVTSKQRKSNVTLISCKNKKLNHRLKQVYSKFADIPLASSGWKNRKACDDYFTINNFRSNPAVIREDLSISFDDYDLDDDVKKVLNENGITKPTVIQNACIPATSDGGNILCCGQTGSGKTLAYLIPVLNQLYRYHQTSNIERHKALVNSPLSLVLTPSRELAFQVYEVANLFAQSLGLNVQLAIGGERTKKAIENPNFEFGIDMLISTPGVLRKFTSSTLIKLNRISHAVFDEVDTLLDDSFSHDTLALLKRINTSQEFTGITPNVEQVHGVKMMFIGATLPLDLKEKLKNLLDLDSLIDVSPHHLLHQVMPHVSQKFMRVRSSEKAPKALYFASHCHSKNQPIMIFTSDSKTCHWLHKFLEVNNIDNIELHSGMNRQERTGRFESFVAGFSPVLTCTDLGSRGLDTTHVQHVLNYNFPSHLSDYIHRVGRVGRVGAQINGSVLSYICKPWEVDAVQEIEGSQGQRLGDCLQVLHAITSIIKLLGGIPRRDKRACRRNIPLSKVDANIKKQLNDHHLRKEEENAQE